MKSKEEVIKIIENLLIGRNKSKYINYVSNYLYYNGFDYLYAYNETVQSFLMIFKEENFNPSNQNVFTQSALFFENAFSHLKKY